MAGQQGRRVRVRVRARRQNNSPAAAAGEPGDYSSSSLGGRVTTAHQIDPVIIRFHYGKMQRRKRHDVANARDMTIGGDHQPGNGGNILIVIDQWIQPQRLLQRMQVGRPLISQPSPSMTISGVSSASGNSPAMASRTSSGVTSPAPRQIH